MKYQVIMGHDHIVLQTKVEELLAEGWDVTGGVSCAVGPSGTGSLFQAMVFAEPADLSKFLPPMFGGDDLGDLDDSEFLTDEEDWDEPENEFFEKEE